MKLLKTAAALALTLSAACAMPVMAQSTGAGSTASPPAGTAPAAASTAPDTRSMGAGPSTTDSRPADTRDNDRDLGWLGLLGLAGLLGLRRRHDDNHISRDNRTTASR
jgi:hypothetical protein